jgi:hypothetical protein
MLSALIQYALPGEHIGSAVNIIYWVGAKIPKIWQPLERPRLIEM